MCFRLSKKQIIILLVFSLIGGVLGLYDRLRIRMIDCPLDYGFPYECLVYSVLLIIFYFGILTYLIEIIYNYFKK